VQVNREKQYVVAQGGVILQRLHAALDANGLAMINLGSISEQTLAGMVTTATHGTGYDHRVLSTHVLAIRLLLPDGTRITCSESENCDIFAATLCGLGSTGIILDIKMQVRPKFRLREIQRTETFDDVVDDLDHVVRQSEFVRLWWWPQSRAIRVSAMDEIKGDEVRPLFIVILMPVLNHTPQQPTNPLHSWLWHSFVGYHVVQLLLFVGILMPWFNLWVARFTAWLVNERTETVDDSLNVFNMDCKVRNTGASLLRALVLMMTHSIANTPQNGRYHTNTRRSAYASFAIGLRRSLRTRTGCALTVPWRFEYQRRTTCGFRLPSANVRAGSESCSTSTLCFSPLLHPP
jgi:L-gulonolactone oxidase